MKAIYLEWDDSAGHAGWMETRDIDINDTLIRSIGWLITESDDAVVISTSHDAPDSWESPLVIPKVAIRKRIYVETP